MPPATSMEAAAVMERERLTADLDDANKQATSSFVVKIRRRLPDFARSVNLKYVRLGLLFSGAIFHAPSSWVPLALVPPLLAYSFARPRGVDTLLSSLDVQLACVAWLGAAALLITLYYIKRPRPVYLVEFACYRPDDAHAISKDGFLDMTECTGFFTPDALEFQTKITRRSGLGDRTYLPPGIQARPPRLSLEEARAEAEAVLFGCLDALFRATGVDPRRDVRVLVVNCSLFNPTPSLASAVVNRYAIRDDVRAFNLGGMGCSAGLIAVGLARDALLQAANSCGYAVVVSTENVTLNWYLGADRSMLLSNCIFRMGGAAALLSTRRVDAKYRLLHVMRTHRGADDGCFRCVVQREDDDDARGGRVGVALARELMAVAGDALKTNITRLGPLVLPLAEQLRFLRSLVLRHVLGSRSHPYIPDFSRAFDHFCVHAGGRAVLEEVQRSLGLGDADMEPSRCALHRFGNTSSSSLWYELAYAEAKGRIRRGHRVWQIGFGSGFKCNSAVWQALRDLPPVRAGDNGCSPWVDSVDSYPPKAYI